MANTYYESDQQPKIGDIIEDMTMDSPCIVVRTYGYRFERVKIGPKAKVFGGVLSNWKKPASSFKLIQHQDDVEWMVPSTKMSPNITCAGDIFMDKSDHSVYYMAINPVNQQAHTVQLVDISSDDEFIVDSDLSTVWFIINQKTVPVPEYTKDALVFLLGDSHYPEEGDIYSDKYNVCYQIVEMPSSFCLGVKLAAMQPKSYHSKNDDWPMYFYKELAAYKFFEKAMFLGTPDEVLHAPNIGDIYMWSDTPSDNASDNQYMICTDIADKYMAPTMQYIDDLFENNGMNPDYLGSKWDSLEQFIEHKLGAKQWTFLENQDDIVGGPPNKPINKWGEQFSAYALPAVTKEQIKLGALLAYVPDGHTYHDCIVVTTGESGFSVWWLAFEGGEDSELQEGFKQTFKYEKHLPLFLYNGLDTQYKGTPILHDDTKAGALTLVNGKPPVKLGQIIDYTTKGGHVTTCQVIKVQEFGFNIILIDQTDVFVSEMEYSFDDYFKQKEWTFVQEGLDEQILNFDFGELEKQQLKDLYKSIPEDKLTNDEVDEIKAVKKDISKASKITGEVPVVNDMKVEHSGYVEGTINKFEVHPVPTLMEGMILNYYPFKDIKETGDKQKESFWTCLVVEIKEGEFAVVILDKGNGEGSDGYGWYFFSEETYLMGAASTLKYVQHMNDTALMSDYDDTVYYEHLNKIAKQGVTVVYPTGMTDDVSVPVNEA